MKSSLKTALADTRASGVVDIDGLPDSAHLTINEIAADTLRHRNTVENWIKSGKLAASKVGNKYLVRVGEYRRFLRESEGVSHQQPPPAPRTQTAV